jgi:hypothetical protein
MEKDLASRLNRLFCLGFVISSLACAQEATTSLSYTWDQPTGDFYATAQATLDYNSSYYYYVCVYIDLWQSSTDSFTYTSGVCDDEDAEQDWDTSVDTSTPLTIDLESENDIYMNYYADQFGDWPDGYCWDAYQAYYFDDFTDESGAAEYDFEGPPGQGIPIPYIPLFQYAQQTSCGCTLTPSSPQSVNASMCPLTGPTNLGPNAGNFGVAYVTSSCSVVSGTCLTPSVTTSVPGDLTASSTYCNVNTLTQTQTVQYSGPKNSKGAGGGGDQVSVNFSLTLLPLHSTGEVTTTCGATVVTVNCP